MEWNVSLGSADVSWGGRGGGGGGGAIRTAAKETRYRLDGQLIACRSVLNNLRVFACVQKNNCLRK